MNLKLTFASAVATLALISCGGGGGSSSGGGTPPTPPPPPPPPAVAPVITGPATAFTPAVAGTAAAGATITAAGTAPITFAISAGSLPPGMTLNGSTGAIAGTPLMWGTFDFTVAATNAAGSVSAPFRQLVEPAVPNANLLLDGNRLVAFNTEVPTALESPIDIMGLAATENLVGIARRPGNGFLYGFAVNGMGLGAVYSIAPSGAATALDFASGFIQNDGVTADPITGTRFGVHVSPGADVLRVASDTGRNFRYSLRVGRPMDGNAGVVFAQMDSPINGATNRIDSLAYTNNALFETLSTLYTVDSLSDALCIQNPANAGTQVSCLPLSMALEAVHGFTIAPGVNTLAQGTPVAGGSARAVLRLHGETTERYAQIDLTTGVIAANPQPIGNGGVRGFAIQAQNGIPMYALTVSGQQLLVFNSASPGTFISRPITGIGALEVLVGIDFQPSTGRLFGFAVNTAANTGTLYQIEPQTGAASGLANIIAFVDDAGIARDFPVLDFGWGFDFNPVTGFIRVTTGADLNFRINAATGGPVDRDPATPGVQADFDVNPAAGIASGLAYTNGFDIGTANTTAYVIDTGDDQLCLLNPANGGTLANCQPLRINGNSVPWGNRLGFDISGDVRASAPGAQVTSGVGYVATGNPNVTHLYEVDLVTAAVTDLGVIGDGTAPVAGFTVGTARVR
jgi:uncharacterized protein DUF4394/putative Ig domain-containing protein